MTLSPIVQAFSETDAKILTKSQKTFQKLIEDIDLKRQLLREWESESTRHHRKYADHFVPLLNSFNGLRETLLVTLDNAYGEKGLSKNMRQKIQDIICTLAGELLMGDDNDRVKEIYNRYSDTDYDTELQAELEDWQATMADFMDIPEEDAMPQSPEEWLRHMQEEQDAEARQREEAKNTRKKSAKASAKEAKEKEAEVQVSQSIREVYRQLAKVIHPDKEQDLAERERKTLLMQRVNEAYQKKSLLTLLEIQLEVEQIDQAALQNISEERLKHYNKILKTQYAELCQEIRDVEFSFKDRFGIDYDRRLAPKQLIPNLQKEIRDIDRRTASLKEDLRIMKTVEGVKLWLKYL